MVTREVEFSPHNWIKSHQIQLENVQTNSHQFDLIREKFDLNKKNSGS